MVYILCNISRGAWDLRGHEPPKCTPVSGGGFFSPINPTLIVVRKTLMCIGRYTRYDWFTFYLILKFFPALYSSLFYCCDQFDWVVVYLCCLSVSVFVSVLLTGKIRSLK